MEDYQDMAKWQHINDSDNKWKDEGRSVFFLCLDIGAVIFFCLSYLVFLSKYFLMPSPEGAT